LCDHDKHLNPILRQNDYPLAYAEDRSLYNHAATDCARSSARLRQCERCFHYADMQELTGRVLVTTDYDKAEAKADPLATEIG